MCYCSCCKQPRWFADLGVPETVLGFIFSPPTECRCNTATVASWHHGDTLPLAFCIKDKNTRRSRSLKRGRNGSKRSSTTGSLTSRALSENFERQRKRDPPSFFRTAYHKRSDFKLRATKHGFNPKTCLSAAWRRDLLTEKQVCMQTFLNA